MAKEIKKTFGILRDMEVVKDLPTTDDSLWAVASCEVVDSMGDIVRQDGLDYSEYHQPPTRYMKILAGHARSLPDGTPPIVGRIEEFRKANINVDGKAVPATLFRMTFSPEDLGQKYKRLFDAGYLDSFSIGFVVEDYEDMEDTGGMDIKKASLFETSAVTIPALAQANVLREIKKELGDLVEVKVGDDEETFRKLLKDIEQIKQQTTPVQLDAAELQEGPDIDAMLVKQLEPVLVVMKGLDEKLATFSTIVSSINDRLDTMESAMVLMTSKQAKEEPKVDEKAVAALASRADSLLKFMSN